MIRNVNKTVLGGDQKVCFTWFWVIFYNDLQSIVYCRLLHIMMVLDSSDSEWLISVPPLPIVQFVWDLGLITWLWMLPGWCGSGLGKNLYANGLVSSSQWIGMPVIWVFWHISPTNPKRSSWSIVSWPKV